MSAKDYPPSVSLYAVEAVEVNQPLGTEPIQGAIVDHPPSCLSRTSSINQLDGTHGDGELNNLFAILKTAALNLETTQLESIAAIQRLTLLALSVAVRILQLIQSRDNPDLPATVTFSHEQQQCLLTMPAAGYAYAPTVEGNTKLQKNPYPPDSLAWATWIIARIGGRVWAVPCPYNLSHSFFNLV
ncbi:transposase [Nostoc carneum NIES-2107]|nr:transposase [Nostoc carneum NIES-2107]